MTTRTPELVRTRRDLLVLELETQVTFRQRKAEEYPDDARNARAARDLEAMMAYVRDLPTDDPDLNRLVAIEDAAGEGAADAYELTFALGQWNTLPGGIEPSAIQPAAFLKGLVDTMEREAMRRKPMTTDPTESLRQDLHELAERVTDTIDRVEAVSPDFPCRDDLVAYVRRAAAALHDAEMTLIG